MRRQSLSAIMDLGELLLIHGAEVSRVEDTITRLGKRFGFVRVDVFSITSSIVVTAFGREGEAYTQTRRIRKHDTNLEIVAEANAASREVCGQVSVTEQEAMQILQSRIEKIRQAQVPHGRRDLLMYMLISASLSVFFGGTPRDALAAMLAGIVLYVSQYLSAKAQMNNLIMNTVCSFVAGAAAILLVRIGIGLNPDKIMIGNIMLVIPGIQFTNSLRDMINGDTISGLLNLTEAILKALAVAAGFALAMQLLR